ncbi:hypothetical protein JOF56_005930 [Kibdelosporangium banguiense]|uniref:DUF4386 domain-containing protein n=1 Tax=Kibdelosporangium banguiense TaxID=1365924 RepID=A0ABS4TMB8_9PSEU|nr:hypothetical protein [Kibdelosporangium banguiense]MBP2325545.1 hypothetical protein [Kibdelosporangium banguiense]
MTRKLNIVQVGGVAAIGFAIMIVLGNAIVVPAGFPLTGTEIAEVTAFFTTNSGLVGLASALAPAAWVLATIFGAGALCALWQSERGWALVGFAGLLLQNAAFAGVIALRLALTNSPDGALWALHDALFTLNGTFLAIALVGLSVSGLRAGFIRPWHGILGLTSAVFMFSSATLTPLVIDHAGPLGLLGLTGWLMWVAWIVTWGVRLVRLRQSVGSGLEPEGVTRGLQATLSQDGAGHRRQGAGDSGG